MSARLGAPQIRLASMQPSALVREESNGTMHLISSRYCAAAGSGPPRVAHLMRGSSSVLGLRVHLSILIVLCVSLIFYRQLGREISLWIVNSARCSTLQF